MQVPQIRMEAQLAQIQISQQHGEIELKQPNADLSIQQPKADLSIQTTKGKLTIDQTKAWEDMNLLSPMRSVEKNAAKGRQAIDEGTARRARQGTELMRIENDTNPIVSQAKINGGLKDRQLSIKYIPSVFAVDLHYEKGMTDVQFTTYEPIIDTAVRKPELTYYRGGVNISMAQYNELHIDFVNLFPERRLPAMIV